MAISGFSETFRLAPFISLPIVSSCVVVALFEIASGKLPPDAIERHYEAEAKNVFGHDAKKVKGQYVEQGFGSAINQTRNSIEAYRKYHSGDPDFAETLARMERELVETNRRRAAVRLAPEGRSAT